MVPTETPDLFIPGDPTATPLGESISHPSYLAGKIAFAGEDYAQVVIEMGAVIEADPSLAPPHWYIGRSLYFLDDCTGALVEIEIALDLDPNYGLAWVDYGLINSCLENADLVLPAYERALSIDPSLARAHHNIGVVFANQGNYREAAREYHLAVDIDPTRVNSWTNLGDVQSEIGEYSACIHSTSTALILDPEYWDAYRIRSLCKAISGNFDEAFIELELYIENVDPSTRTDGYLIWYNLGVLRSNVGDLRGAITAYTNSIALNSEHYPVFINRGSTYHRLEEYQLAVRDETAAIALIEQAIAEGLPRQGDLRLALLKRADAYFGLELFDSAILDFEAGLYGNPDPCCYMHLANAYFEADQPQEAIDTLQLGVRYFPELSGEPAFHEILGKAYYELGNYEDALLYLDLAMQAQPFVDGYYYRGITHQALGHTFEALNDLHEYLLNVQFLPNWNEMQDRIREVEQRIDELEQNP